MQPRPRYAIYYAPEASEPLSALGRAWLGYDAEMGERCAQVGTAAIGEARLAELTAEPRRYGFHGTLKPPFVLSPDATEAMLVDEARAFAATQEPVTVGPMTASVISSFIALVPNRTPAALGELAAKCVEYFDRFRAAPTAAELARRRAAGLSLRQDELLLRWGYPYVMEEFRFHLTLTGRISLEEQDVLLPVLGVMFAPAGVGPVAIRSLAVFKQPSPSEPFRILVRVPLTAQPARLRRDASA